MTTPTEHAAYGLSILPKRPSYVAYTLTLSDVTQGITDLLTEQMGIDMSEYCYGELHDEDSEYHFYLVDYAIEENLTEEQIDLLETVLGGNNIDDYFEYTHYLIAKWMGVEEGSYSWVYAQGHHESPYVDVQFGIPKA